MKSISNKSKTTKVISSNFAETVSGFENYYKKFAFWYEDSTVHFAIPFTLRMGVSVAHLRSNVTAKVTC